MPRGEQQRGDRWEVTDSELSCSMCRASTGSFGRCDVCQSRICERCAPEHNASHDGTPLDSVASYLDRGAEIAQGVSQGLRQVQVHLTQAFALFGVQLGKPRRRRRRVKK